MILNKGMNSFGQNVGRKYLFFVKKGQITLFYIGTA